MSPRPLPYGPTLPKWILAEGESWTSLRKDPLENSPSSFVFVATSRELLSTGAFVIGSDDRLPLLDNSPFMLKAKGKYRARGKAARGHGESDIGRRRI